jgi:hypothetical protein
LGVHQSSIPRKSTTLPKFTYASPQFSYHCQTAAMACVCFSWILVIEKCKMEKNKLKNKIEMKIKPTKPNSSEINYEVLGIFSFRIV